MFVSEGSLVESKTPSFTNSSWFPSMPPMSSRNWPSAYAGIYSGQLWTYVVINKLAKAIARLPLPVYRSAGQDRTRDDTHPLAVLLEKPNPAMSGFGLKLWTSSTCDIHGDAFWLKKRQGGRVVALWPLHPASMTWESDKGSWRFDNGGLVLPSIPDSDLVHFRYFHPDSMTRGMSPLEPLRATLENEWHARNATSSFWQNGARPGTALSHPGNLSQPAMERLRAQWDGLTAGSGKTGSTVVLEEGMKPETLTLTAEEAQYIETRKLNREEVCAAYDVPPPVVHILDRATFSNITEQMRSMYRDTMAPRCNWYEAAVELDLRQAEWPNDDVYAEFLMDEVLRGDFEARQDALAKATHMTIAEKRKVENLPFIEGTDRIFLNTATMPLDAIDAQSAALVAQTEAGTQPQQLGVVVPLSVARSAMGRLSWQRRFSDIDPATLVDTPGPAKDAVQAAYNAEKASRAPTVTGLRNRIRDLAAKDVQASRKAQGTHEETIRQTLVKFFDRQAAAVTSAAGFKPDRWNAELTDDLHAVAVEVAALVGAATAKDLGYNPSVYDADRTTDFLRAVAARIAGNVNDTTKSQLEATDDIGHVFEMAKDSRAAGIAAGTATLVSGFAVVETGHRISEAHGRAPKKTWVTGSNPRAAHASMNGETVDLHKPFSNGMQWPGDSSDADEVASCNCTVTIG
jgi:HK97 family phage portal protein